MLALLLDVNLRVPAGGEEMPIAAFPITTFAASAAGVVAAMVLRRTVRTPARVFLIVSGALTALSLVPPFLVGADTSTALTLASLHLLAAAIVIPALHRRLSTH